MKITWYGAASVGLADGRTRLLFDPFCRMNRRLPEIPAADFTGFDYMLLTHGHFDHIMVVPEILRQDPDVKVYCTATPLQTLVRLGADRARLHLIAPGDVFEAGSFTVTVRRGKHISFDAKYILSVVPRIALHPFRALKLATLIKNLPENGEIVSFEIASEGKTVLLLGSYGFVPDETYAENADLMVFPFSGNSGVAQLAAPDLRRLRPKRLFFDHFDDAFPPLTKRMDVEGYLETLKKDLPGAEAIIPAEEKTYEF